MGARSPLAVESPDQILDRKRHVRAAPEVGPGLLDEQCPEVREHAADAVHELVVRHGAGFVPVELPGLI